MPVLGKLDISVLASAATDMKTRQMSMEPAYATARSCLRPVQG